MQCEDGLLEPELVGRRGIQELLDAVGPWHVLQLRDVRVDSPWLAFAEDGVLSTDDERGVGVIDTTMEFDDCLHKVPKNMRNTIRKARRRIDERGGAEVVVHREAELEAAFDRFLVLEASGWKGNSGSGWLNMPIEAGIWRDYLLGPGDGQVRSLMINGTLAAAQVTVRYGRTLFLPRIAYNENLKELSPSNVLMADLINACCEDPGIDRLDCITWQGWHQHWGMVREPTHHLVVFNDKSVRGVALHAAWWARRQASTIGVRCRLPGFRRRHTSD